MLIATVIIVALAILIAVLFLHMSYTYGAMKGYERGLDDAEAIMREVKGNEEVSEYTDRP